MKEISDEDKEKYSFGDYWLIQNQILLTNIKKNCMTDSEDNY